MPDPVVDVPVEPADRFFLELDGDASIISTMGSLYLLAGEPEHERVLASLRTLEANAPRFRQIVDESEDGLVWRTVSLLDVAEHLTELSIGPEAPVEAALRAVDEFYARPWDRGRPLWDGLLVRGLEKGRALFILRINHALGDGVLFYRSWTRSDGSDAGASDGGRERRPSRLERGMRELRRSLGELAWAAGLLRDALSGRRAEIVPQLRSHLEYVRSVLRGNRRGIGRPSVRRRLSLAEVPLESWKHVATAHGGGVNELFLATCGRIVIDYYAERGIRLDEANVVMPINIRLDENDLSPGNHATRAQVMLNVAECRELRLASIRERSRSSMQRDKLPVSPLAARLQAAVLPGVLRDRLVHRSMQLADCVASNLKFERGDLRFGGLTVESWYAIAPATGVPATFCLATYNGVVHVSATIDPGLVPDPDRFIAIFQERMRYVRSGGEQEL